MLSRSQQISTMRSLLPAPKLNIYLVTYDRGSDQSGVKKPDHWAVFITKSPSDADGHVFQIVHGRPVFAFSYRDSVMLEGSGSRKKSPVIGKVKANNIAKINEAFWEIPVVNDNPNWNCQNWTRDAIRVLEAMGYVAEGTADNIDDILAAA